MPLSSYSNVVIVITQVDVVLAIFILGGCTLTKVYDLLRRLQVHSEINEQPQCSDASVDAFLCFLLGNKLQTGELLLVHCSSETLELNLE